MKLQVNYKKFKFEVARVFSLLCLIFSITSFSQNIQFDWISIVGGNQYENVKAIAIDKKDNCYIAGNFKGSINIYPNINDSSNFIGFGLFLMKYNSNGNLLWFKIFNCASHPHGNLTDDRLGLAVDDYGYAYLTGNFVNNIDLDPGPLIDHRIDQGDGDMFLVKIDPDGNYAWGLTWGKDYIETGVGITIDNENNIIISGRFGGQLDFDPSEETSIEELDYVNGTRNGFVVKLNRFGHFLWATTFTSSTYNGITNPVVNKDGEIFISGNFYSNNLPITSNDTQINIYPQSATNTLDLFLAKLDKNGNVIWVKVINEPGSNEMAKSIAINENDELFVTGKIEKKMDYSDSSIYSELQLKEKSDILLISFDSSGNFRFVNSYGSDGYDAAKKIFVDQNGDVIIVGDFMETIDFGGTDCTAVSHYDGFLLKLNSLGNYLSTYTIGGGNYDSIEDVEQNSKGDLYIAGKISDEVKINLNNNDTIINALLVDFYLGKIKLKKPEKDSTYVFNECDFFIYPNPATELLNIQISNQVGSYHIYIYNSSGETVLTLYNALSSSISSIPLYELPKGMYIAVIENEYGTCSKKFIKY